MKLREYIRLSRHCVYALVCESKKKVAIGYAEDLLNALYVINRDLETPKYSELKNDIDEIEIVVLEQDIQNNINKKIACGNYVDSYKEQGYTLYYPSNFVRYSVHTDVITYKNLTFLVVYLKDKRSNKKIVGLFKSKDSMDQFIQEYYPNNTFKNIYYADNKYTERYLKNDVDNWSIE